VLTRESNILLTGATGLIGGELLRGLLARGIHRVWTLVRAEGELAPGQRLSRRLACGRPAPELNGCLERALPGDMAAERLGLPRPAESALQQQVDIILHCAADTSFLGRRCRRTNVEGMQHLIDFASGCGRDPLVVYLGTAATCGAVEHRCLTEEEGCNLEAAHHNEYTRSKAEAERLLRESGLRHLIVRPSVVLSTGLADPELAATLLWFMPLLNEFEAVPIDARARMDVVPVGWVADSVLRLLAVSPRRYRCYHLSAGATAAPTWGEICAYLDEYYRRPAGLKLIPPPDWTRAVQKQYIRTPRQRLIFSRLRYYLPFINMDVVYDNGRLREELGGDAARLPRALSCLTELLPLIDLEEALAASRSP